MLKQVSQRDTCPALVDDASSGQQVWQWSTSVSSSESCPASISFRIAMAVIGLEMLPMRIIVVGCMARPELESANPTAPAQFSVPPVAMAKLMPVSSNSVRAARSASCAAAGQASNVSGGP
jgi:hypothetical protein